MKSQNRILVYFEMQMLHQLFCFVFVFGETKKINASAEESKRFSSGIGDAEKTASLELGQMVSLQVSNQKGLLLSPSRAQSELDQCN